MTELVGPPSRAQSTQASAQRIQLRSRICEMSDSRAGTFFCLRTLFAGIVVMLLMSCQGRPVRELILADVALRSAQKAKADALSPDGFRKAENFYLRAKKDFTDGYYDACRKHANQARLLAEKAEYRANWKQTRAKEKVLGDSPSATGPAEGEDE